MDTESATMVSLGEPLPSRYRRHSGEDISSRLSYNAQECSIWLNVCNCTEAEIAAAQTGDLFTGLLKHRDALFIVLALRGCMTVDISFDIDRVHPSNKPFPKYDTGQGRLMNLIMSDPVDNWIVKVIRVFSLSPQFCKFLEIHIENMELRKAAGAYDFDSSFQEAMEIYPSPNTMVPHCDIFEQGGRDFNEVDGLWGRVLR